MAWGLQQNVTVVTIRRQQQRWSVQQHLGCWGEVSESGGVPDISRSESHDTRALLHGTRFLQQGRSNSRLAISYPTDEPFLN